jgi:hypothetical protein
MIDENTHVPKNMYDEILPKKRVKCTGGLSTCKNVSLRFINFENAFLGS